MNTMNGTMISVEDTIGSPSIEEAIIGLPPPDIAPWDDSHIGEDERTTVKIPLSQSGYQNDWMRIATIHQMNEEYWREKAVSEFSRFERLTGQKQTGNHFRMFAFYGMGAAIYDVRWVLMSAVFFGLSLIMDKRTKRDER